MNKFLFLIIIPFSLLAQNNPPQDYIVKQVAVDENDHVFFDLGASSSTLNPTVKTQTGWDIAFYNESHEIGGKINETKGVRVYRVYKDTTQFNSVTLTDTVNQVYNSESIFYLGALDTFYSGNFNTFFNIGIGDFYNDNYNAYPDRIYIIKREDNVWGKFYIRYTNSTKTFTIRYADMDNTNAKTLSVVKSISPMTRHYTYVKLQDGTINGDFEPLYNGWDIMFRKYKVGTTTYPIGILTNNAHNLVRLSSITGFPDEYLGQGVVKTDCYEAIGDPSTVTYNGSLNGANPISRLYNQIGEKWFNTSTNQPISGKSYFIKDKLARLWHLVLCNYNSTSKTLEFAYQHKGSASIDNAKFQNDMLVLQSENSLTIENLSQKTNTTYISFYDISGKEIYQNIMTDKITIDVTTMRNKLIFIHTENNSIFHHFKYFVQ